MHRFTCQLLFRKVNSLNENTFRTDLVKLQLNMLHIKLLLPPQNFPDLPHPCALIRLSTPPWPPWSVIFPPVLTFAEWVWKHSGNKILNISLTIMLCPFRNVLPVGRIIRVARSKNSGTEISFISTNLTRNKITWGRKFSQNLNNGYRKIVENYQFPHSSNNFFLISELIRMDEKVWVFLKLLRYSQERFDLKSTKSSPALIASYVHIILISSVHNWRLAA